MKQCAHPDCTNEFEGRPNQIYCSHNCKVMAFIIKQRKKNEGQPEDTSLKEWQEAYIKERHLKDTVERIAVGIKKSTALVKRYCQDNNLPFKEAPYLRKPVYVKPYDDQPKEIKRPPAIYSNKHPHYGVQNYKERLLCR